MSSCKSSCASYSISGSHSACRACSRASIIFSNPTHRACHIDQNRSEGTTSADLSLATATSRSSYKLAILACISARPSSPTLEELLCTDSKPYRRQEHWSVFRLSTVKPARLTRNTLLGRGRASTLPTHTGNGRLFDRFSCRKFTRRRALETNTKQARWVSSTSCNQVGAHIKPPSNMY